LQVIIAATTIYFLCNNAVNKLLHRFNYCHKYLSGNPAYVTIPLIGYKKFGADGVVDDLEKEK
jgi:hypothetical protein